MKSRLLVIALLSFLMGSANASATPLRFTAADAVWGTLGFMDYDSSVFDSTSFQFVDNTFILQIDFTDPRTSSHVVMPGPDGSGTYFDSTGLLPTVVGGSGPTGGSSPNDVWIAGSNIVWMGSSYYLDVTWTTSSAPGQVPDAGSSLLLLGIGLAGLRACRKR
jgi:hypothetical protein